MLTTESVPGATGRERAAAKARSLILWRVVQIKVATLPNAAVRFDRESLRGGRQVVRGGLQGRADEDLARMLKQHFKSLCRA
jgi:hypothetical protein